MWLRQNTPAARFSNQGSWRSRASGRGNARTTVTTFALGKVRPSRSPRKSPVLIDVSKALPVLSSRYSVKHRALKACSPLRAAKNSSFVDTGFPRPSRSSSVHHTRCGPFCPVSTMRVPSPASSLGRRSFAVTNLPWDRKALRYFRSRTACLTRKKGHIAATGTRTTPSPSNPPASAKAREGARQRSAKYSANQAIQQAPSQASRIRRQGRRSKRRWQRDSLRRRHSELPQRTPNRPIRRMLQETTFGASYACNLPVIWCHSPAIPRSAPRWSPHPCGDYR